MSAGFVTLLAAGCGRAYLTPSWGRSFRQSFAVQTVNPDRRSDAKMVHGLDSQEAAIISASYRKSLSPKDVGGAGDQQMLTYSPRTGVSAANVVPATSVPAEH